MEGLRATITAAFDYSLRSLDADEDAPDDAVPVALLMQARVAARTGVSLDTVLRRYFAGYNLLLDFIMREAEEGGFSGAAIRRLVFSEAILFDRLLAAVTDEHSQVWERTPGSTEERRVGRVRAVLGGEPVEPEELAYDFGRTHVGVVASGVDSAAILQDLALGLDARHLIVRPDDRTTWAWLAIDSARQHSSLSRILTSSPGSALIGLGELADDLSGWRLTHRQAKASLSVAMRESRRVVHYVDVAMLAGIAGDRLLSESLRCLYLTPLAAGRDGGETLRETLRAYFAADRNVSSAAAALSVNRQTVVNRLRVVEERVGRPLHRCAADLEIALRLDAFDRR